MPFLPLAPKITLSSWQPAEGLSSLRRNQPPQCPASHVSLSCRSPRICVSAAPMVTLGPQSRPPWWLASLPWLWKQSKFQPPFFSFEKVFIRWWNTPNMRPSILRILNDKHGCMFPFSLPFTHHCHIHQNFVIFPN